MSTPHNSAKYGQFAKTVLMPGDPLRAKWIASSFLEEAALVTRVRNVYGYTGKYKGERISVMSVGTPDFRPCQHIIDAVSEAASKPENYGYSLADLPELLDAVSMEFVMAWRIVTVPL